MRFERGVRGTLDYLSQPDRVAYETVQKRRGTKHSYCKVSARDVATYLRIVRGDHQRRSDTRPAGPIVCLGVRNGREVDLFRISLRGSSFTQAMARGCERRWHGFTSWVPLIERVGRDDYRTLHSTACVGVELNPMARRPDVRVGSFDALPDDWAGRFGIVFSNALDHARNPWTTAAAWWRLLRDGGYMVLDFPHEQPANWMNPVAALTRDDVMSLFPGMLIFFQYRGSANGYSTFVIRKGETS